MTPELVRKVKGIFLWVIKSNGVESGKWTVDLANGNGQVYKGESKNGGPELIFLKYEAFQKIAAKANTTLTLEDSDMVKLVGGNLNAQQAFMTGKLKIKGNIMLTQKLQTLFADAKAKM